MTIISALPYTLANGTVADATQVMANFNQILNNVNANAQLGGATVNLGQTTSNVNYIQAAGNTTGNAPILSFTGSDTSVGAVINVKGTGSYIFNSGAGQQFGITSTASAVNYLAVTGAPTGVAPNIMAVGTDTNVNLAIISQGTGFISMQTGNGVQCRIINAPAGATSVNYFQVQGSATTAPVSLSCGGSDSSINMLFQIKGALSTFTFQNDSSAVNLILGQAANAVNYLQINSAATTLGPLILGLGSDTNVDIIMSPKGTGKIQVNGGGISINTGRGFQLINQTSQAASGTGTLTNAPVNGNPAFWLPVIVNGTNRSIPCW